MPLSSEDASQEKTIELFSAIVNSKTSLSFGEIKLNSAGGVVSAIGGGGGFSGSDSASSIPPSSAPISNCPFNGLGSPSASTKGALKLLKMAEPLLIAGDDVIKKVNIQVKVNGGGFEGQAEAARLAIARGLVQFTNNKQLERNYLDYDRQLLVADIRQRESRKPNTHSKARSKVQKSYR